MPLRWTTSFGVDSAGNLAEPFLPPATPSDAATDIAVSDVPSPVSIEEALPIQQPPQRTMEELPQSIMELPLDSQRVSEIAEAPEDKEQPASFREDESSDFEPPPTDTPPLGTSQPPALDDLPAPDSLEGFATKNPDGFMPLRWTTSFGVDSTGNL